MLYCVVDARLLVNRIVTKKQHPEALRPLLSEIDAFARHNHGVLHTILRYDYVVSCVHGSRYKVVARLLALGLGVHENTFVNQHGWDKVGETYGEPDHQRVCLVVLKRSSQ